MFWVIQSNLFEERGYGRFVETIEKIGSPCVLTKPVPFTDRLVEADCDGGDVDDLDDLVVETDLPVVAFGATAMNRIAQARGWVPGTFLTPNHDFNVWRNHIGDELLNGDSVVCRFDQVVPPEEMFIRPTLDSKSFSGTVMSGDDFQTWQEKVIQLGQDDEQPTIRPSTMVCYAPVKQIMREWRFFVVDQKVITGSLYRQGNQVIYSPDDTAKIVMALEDLFGTGN